MNTCNHEIKYLYTLKKKNAYHLAGANCQHLLYHIKSKKVPEKHIFLLYWLHQSLWLCGSQQTVDNSLRDGNTRPHYLLPEKSVCRSRSNKVNQTWKNGLFQIAKGVCQGCISSPCLFTLYTEYIRQNAGLDNSQAEIKPFWEKYQ